MIRLRKESAKQSEEDSFSGASREEGRQPRKCRVWEVQGGDCFRMAGRVNRAGCCGDWSKMKTEKCLWLHLPHRGLWWSRWEQLWQTNRVRSQSGQDWGMSRRWGNGGVWIYWSYCEKLEKKSGSWGRGRRSGEDFAFLTWEIWGPFKC